MRILRRFRSEVAAEHAAMHLRGHGIAAAVFGRGTAFARTPLGLPAPGVDLVLLVPDQFERACAVLDELESAPMVLDEDWESDAEPDVRRLDATRVPITCPACDQPLVLDVNIVECGACGMLTDAIERIVQVHGPEALAEAIHPEEEGGSE